MSKIKLENPVGKKAEDLKLYAKRIGVDFTEDVKHNDLVKAVSLRNKELEENGEGVRTNDNATSKEKSGKFFYWIKMKTYIDDDPSVSNTTVNAGLYVLDRKLPRLENQPVSLVEFFEDEISDRKIEEIAKSRGFKLSASDDIDFSELLEKLLNKIS